MIEHKPYVFDEFFASGFEERVSPFLTEKSREWGKNISLRSALSSAIFLFLAFVLSFFNTPLSFLCLSIVYFLAGTPALINTIKDFKSLEINIDVLMTLAAFLAVLIGNAMEGALLLVLFELSGAMESTVTYKARGALHKLHELSPTMGWIVDEDGSMYQMSIKEIPVNAKLLVKAGEIVPLDGKIIEGRSSFNLVHLTGESAPVVKDVEDDVPAGARNLESAITLLVTRTSSDSTLSRIIQLITQAQEAKPKLQRWLDRFGKVYASSVIGLTFLFAFTLPWIFSINYLGDEGSIYRALAFMIAASPCALIIATPTAYLSAISSCARKGILLKGGITLDALASCKTIAFDKTGTLTTGELSLTKVESLQNKPLSEDEEKKILSIAASLERHIVHPIATAIVTYAQKNHIPLIEIIDFKSQPGFGLQGQYDGSLAAIGLPEFISSLLPHEQQQTFSEELSSVQRDGQVLACLLFEGNVYLFRFTDSIREKAKELISILESKTNITSVMLTGDHANTANSVAKLLGIEKVYADLRPEDKLNLVAKLSQESGLAMVGDGINDAPALARATIGISLGKIGSATAIDASDVVLLNDDLHLIHWLLNKAHKTIKIVKENLSLALSVIFLATTPALLGLVPLWLAVVLHEGGTVLVGLNSLRLLKK